MLLLEAEYCLWFKTSPRDWGHIALDMGGCFERFLKDVQDPLLTLVPLKVDGWESM